MLQYAFLSLSAYIIEIHSELTNLPIHWLPFSFLNSSPSACIIPYGSLFIYLFLQLLFYSLSISRIAIVNLLVTGSFFTASPSLTIVHHHSSRQGINHVLADTFFYTFISLDRMRMSSSDRLHFLRFLLPFTIMLPHFSWQGNIIVLYDTPLYLFIYLFTPNLVSPSLHTCCHFTSFFPLQVFISFIADNETLICKRDAGFSLDATGNRV